jgi:multicomponent Na+:H+ antiporter subunit D
VILWPLILPFATVVAVFLLRRRPDQQQLVSLGGAVALALAAALLFAEVASRGPVAVQLGGWPAPYGITFVADMLSAIMVLVTGVAGLAVTLYAQAEVPEDERALAQPALMHVLLGGTCGAFLTGDLFNLYVWFEVILIACFGLLGLRRTRTALAGTMTYIALNLVATTAMLAGVGLLYGTTGALNMADLSQRLAGRADDAAVLAPAYLLAFALSAKAGLFPLFFWLPASYHTPSVTVSALFSALVTKVAVYALFRVFTLLLPLEAVPGLQALMLVVACLTMVVGVLGAAAQDAVRRILAFHIVSQIGYMVLGLALFSGPALAGGLFYMVHNIVAKTNLFLTGGIAARLCGSERLGRMGGLWAARPGLSLLFLLSALAMAGMPPLTGFWAKFFLVHEGLITGHPLAAALALGVGLLTLYSMTKIWAEAFWKPYPGDRPLDAPLPLALRAPALALVLLLVAGGLLIAPVYGAMETAAAQMLDPAAYIAAVLGPRA